jgi:NAD(P)-dependent dehydrogenase (short-subunit alcohol dehydrogenase family)
MDLGLGGRAYLVTGASSGVGLATAAALLAEGAHVAACARDAGRLRAALDPLPRTGRLFTAACDVVDAGAVAAFVDGAAREFGRLDGVVNNAGRSLMAPVARTTDAQWREEFELKIFSVLNTLRAAEPHLRASDAPAAVNVNAILARQPEPRLGATSAARAALLNLTRTLSADLAPIRVNTVSLGLIDTGQWRRRYEEAAAEGPAQGRSYAEWSAEIAADRGIALGRFGRAEEVAYPIVTLLSPHASYITGSTVDVGGGVARYV